MLANNKHGNLLCKIINYQGKKFYNIHPICNPIFICTFNIKQLHISPNKTSLANFIKNFAFLTVGLVSNKLWLIS